MPRRQRNTAVIELRITLRDAVPPIWRRIVVPASMSLSTLHAVIQDVMGWENCHLYQFEVGGRSFEAAEPDTEGQDAGRVTLQGLSLKPRSSFRYTYDFGDDWVHDLTVESIAPADPDMAYPVCTGGARAGPPEDSGGPHGYSEILEILQNPEHPDFAQYQDWLSDGFQPECFDLRATNRILMLAFGGGGAV
jgi:hypothetical protein